MAEKALDVIAEMENDLLDELFFVVFQMGITDVGAQIRELENRLPSVTTSAVYRARSQLRSVLVEVKEQCESEAKNVE